MSRADQLTIPAAPGIGRSVRAAAVDFYFHSWRLVPANAIWGAMLLVLIFLLGVAPILTLLLTPLLALPTVGLFRLAALIVRGESVGFGDAVSAWRLYLFPSLLAGIGLGGTGLVLAFNLGTGITSQSVLGWAFATFAAWGLLVVWCLSLAFWPILVDPLRSELGYLARLRVAALLVAAFPLRIGALALVLAVFLAVSTVLFAALLTISVAYTALVACHYLLPAADRFEGRATHQVPS